MDVQEPRFTFRFGLPQDWSTVKRINEAVSCYTKALFADDTLADSVAMVCTELLENAVKYSTDDQDELKRVLLTIVGDELSVSVKVCNSARANPEDAESLYQTLYRIRRAESTRQAYLDRMEEVFSGLSSGSGLGLVRIAYEGGCDLDCELKEDGSLEVRARFDSPDSCPWPSPGKLDSKAAAFSGLLVHGSANGGEAVLA